MSRFFAGVRARWPRLSPYASLLLGIASAVLMDRRPERAWLVIAGIALGWLGVMLLAFFERAPGPSSLMKSGVRFLALGPVQMTLFFTLPFYVQAWAGTWGQAAFIALVALAALVTLWDPLHHAVLRRPVLGACLQGFATFAGLNALLPVLGVSNSRSLLCSAAAAALVLPLLALAVAPPKQRRGLLPRIGVVTLAALLLAVPAVRRAVPAAPLRLVEGGLGTSITGMRLDDPTERLDTVPESLACYTVIWAPRGLRDALFHVWRKNGRPVDAIPLEVRGGREAGFRTWSKKQHLGPSPGGTWTCSVETASGQVLGERRVLVLAPQAPSSTP